MEAAIPTWAGWVPWVPWVPNIATTLTSLHVAPTSGRHRYGQPTDPSPSPPSGADPGRVAEPPTSTGLTTLLISPGQAVSKLPSLLPYSFGPPETPSSDGELQPRLHRKPPRSDFLMRSAPSSVALPPSPSSSPLHVAPRIAGLMSLPSPSPSSSDSLVWPDLRDGDVWPCTRSTSCSPPLSSS